VFVNLAGRKSCVDIQASTQRGARCAKGKAYTFMPPDTRVYEHVFVPSTYHSSLHLSCRATALTAPFYLQPSQHRGGHTSKPTISVPTIAVYPPQNSKTIFHTTRYQHLSILNIIPIFYTFHPRYPHTPKRPQITPFPSPTTHTRPKIP
jgi:hypothetical protein